MAEIKECKICSKRYAITKYLHFHDDPYSCCDYYQPCPNCGYNPEIEDEIKKTINHNISVKINSDGTIGFNSSELSDLVISQIMEYWPRNKQDKRKK